MKLLGFIFLRRDWQHDKTYLEQKLSELVGEKLPFSLLIFPEGTTFCQETHEKAINYAVKESLVPPKYTLVPRTLGLYASLLALRPNIDGLWDITLAFPKPQLLKPMDQHYTIKNIYFGGHYPRNVHIFLRFIPVSEIPCGKAEFDSWLRSLYNKKDNLLSKFYDGSISGKSRKMPSFRCSARWLIWSVWLVIFLMFQIIVMKVIFQ